MSNKKIVNIVRRLTENLAFRRSLPDEFGRLSIYVMPRNNMLTLHPFKNLAKLGEDLLAAADVLVRQGNVVWDIGANIGLFSVAAAYKTGTSGKVIAVEADDRHTQLLRRTLIHLVGKISEVAVICAGVADSYSITELNIVEHGYEKNHIQEVKGAGTSQTGSVISRKHIVTVTLDWLLNYFPSPDVLKIDVEGAEFMALNGGKHLLKEKRPIIYVEVQNYNQDLVADLLKQFDYRFFVFKKNEKNKFFMREIKHCAFNTIAIPEERSEEIGSFIMPANGRGNGSF